MVVGKSGRSGRPGRDVGMGKLGQNVRIKKASASSVETASRMAGRGDRGGLGEGPKVDSFSIKGRLKTDYKKIAEVLRTISFIEVAVEKDAVDVLYVESRDINKNPYIFSLIKIMDDKIDVVYTIPKGISPTKRRLDVIRYLLNILTLITEHYEVDDKVLYQLIEKSISDILDSISMDYSKLYTAYDSLKKEVLDLRKKVERLTQQNDELTTQNYELKSYNDELKLRLKELEGMSDELLKAKIQEWITEHNGEINVLEFSKVHHVPESRVEQMLNELVNEGYLEVVR